MAVGSAGSAPTPALPQRGGEQESSPAGKRKQETHAGSRIAAQSPLRGLPGQRGRDAGAGRRPERAGRARSRRAAARRRARKHVARGKLLPRERVRDAARPRHAVPRARAARRATACTTTTRPAPASSPASAASPGVECVIVCNDATVKGGTYYPMTVKKHLRAQEIARAEPAALHLPGRLRRRQPAEPGRGVPRPRPLRPHLLQPGQHVSAQGIPQIAVVMGSCTAGGAYVPAMSDEIDHRQEPGHDLPRRPAAGEGGDRRSRQRRGPRRRRRAHAPVGRGRPPGAERPARAGAGARGIVANLNRAQAAPTATARAARADVRRRRAVRRDPDRHAQALRRARGHRPHRRRPRVRRVQGALRHDAGHAASRTSRACRSASSPTTASCSPSPR